MDFQQIRDFVNPAVAQATGIEPVENLSMPVPVAYVPVQLVIDGALSLTSENPVQNKVIAVAIQQLDGRITAIEGQFSEGVTEAVNNWLAAHPEATTTVQDGAITYAKLDSNLKGEVDQISDLKSAIILKKVSVLFYVRDYITNDSVVLHLPIGDYKFDFYAYQIYVKDKNGTTIKSQWNPVSSFNFSISDGDYIQFKVYTDPNSQYYYNPDTAVVYRTDVDGDYADSDLPIIGSVLMTNSVSADKLKNDFTNAITNEVCSSLTIPVNNSTVDISVAKTKSVNIVLNVGTSNNYGGAYVCTNTEKGSLSFRVDKSVMSAATFNQLDFRLVTYRTNAIAEVDLTRALGVDTRLFQPGSRQYQIGSSFVKVEETSDDTYEYVNIHFDLEDIIADNSYINSGVRFYIQCSTKSPYNISIPIENFVISSNDSAKLPYGIYDIGKCDSFYSGRKSIHFGDSITWYDKQVGPNNTVIKGYTSYIDEYFGMIGLNKGVSGQRMTVNGVQTITEITDYTAYDLVTIAHGTNDFKLNSVLGEIGQYDDISFNTNTFYGAYRAAIEHILNSNPSVRIVLFTPLQRDNDGYSIYTTNSQGLKLSDYRQAIFDIADMYGFPVYDAYRCSGITMKNLSYSTYDGLHPNNIGHKMFGESSARFIGSV